VPAVHVAAETSQRALRTARALAAGAAPLAAWALLIALARVLGEHLYHADYLIRIGDPPLVGSADLHLGAGVLPALAFALAALAWAPRLAERLPPRRLLAVAYAAALAWPALLAASDGLDAIPAPLRSRFEYLHDVGRVGSPGRFLSHFVAELPTYATHVKGHPPGMVLLLWALARAGLGGATAAAVAILLVAALAAPATLLALRELAGPAAMRAAAPFVALAPGAIWIATSDDALFMGVAACGIALLALASGRRDRRGDLLALGGGVALGALLALTYGAVPLGTVVLAIALHRRRVRPLLLAAAGVAAVLGALAVAGFWWLDGLHATRALYAAGVAHRRPYLDFLLIDLAALALATGPALAAALGRLRGRGAWVLPGGALATVALADLSGLSRGETERIWLPFVPLLLCATAALTVRRRGWLAAQLALALALQVGIRSPW
jgi:hypothetical protein